MVACAGMSRRYGSPKLLAKLPGTSQSLISHVISELVAGGANPVLAILGPESEHHFREIAKHVKLAGGMALHCTPAPAEMLQSIQFGIRFLNELIQRDDAFRPDFLLFTPADLPATNREFVARQIQHCLSQPADLIRGQTPQGRGIHPVGMKWHITNLLNNLDTSIGLKTLWLMPELTRFEWVWNCTQIFHDLDNPHDWEKFRKQD